MRSGCLISIIIPIYKVEKYLSRCLDSLIPQCVRRTEIEIILVNDGSPDRCPAICDKYRDYYPSLINVIHKDNGGLASARNAGLDNAHGRYISFVDSDDVVSASYIENVLIAIKDDPEIVIFGYEIRYSDTNRRIVKKGPSQGVLSVQNAIRAQERDGSFNMVWNKLYNRDIIGTALRFKLGSEPCEDILFNIGYFGKIKQAKTIELPIYYYMRQNEDSQANTFRKDLVEKNRQIIRSRVQFYSTMGLSTLEDEKLLAKGNIEYVFSAIPNMYRGKKRTFEEKERIDYYRKILESQDINTWVKKLEDPSRMMILFRTLYATHSAYVMDNVFLILMGARNRFSYLWNRVRGKFF